MSENIICPRCKSDSIVDQRMTKTGRQPLWKCENFVKCRNLAHTNWPWSSWDDEPEDLKNLNPKLFNKDSHLNNELLDVLTDDIKTIAKLGEQDKQSIMNLIEDINKRIDSIESINNQRILNFHETSIFENDEERYIRESLESEEEERIKNKKLTGIEETDFEKNARETLYSTKDACPSCSKTDGTHAPICYT